MVKPETIPLKGVSVLFDNTFLNELPAERCKPSVIIFIANKNKPRPPNNDPSEAIISPMTPSFYYG